MSRPLRFAPTLAVSCLLVACAAQEPKSPVVAGPSRAPEARAPSAPEAPSALAGRRFSLLAKLEIPPLPEIEGEKAVPLNSPDPRYTEYFAELKRRIEARWSYPTEASRRGESGEGEVRFALRRDGSVKTVETVKSSGVTILDDHIKRAIQMAAPFPPIPAPIAGEVLPISINFKYTLQGYRFEPSQ